MSYKTNVLEYHTNHTKNPAALSINVTPLLGYERDYRQSQGVDLSRLSGFSVSHTAVSRKVVDKSLRANTEWLYG